MVNIKAVPDSTPDINFAPLGFFVFGHFSLFTDITYDRWIQSIWNATRTSNALLLSKLITKIMSADKITRVEVRVIEHR